MLNAVVNNTKTPLEAADPKELMLRGQLPLIVIIVCITSPSYFLDDDGCPSFQLILSAERRLDLVL